MPRTTTANFEEDLTSAFRRVRRSLSELLTACGTDPSEPQEIARRLGLNRNLTWRISKVIRGDDLFASLQQLPSDEGLNLLIKAAEGAGVAPLVANNLRDAQSEFSRVIEIHSGDRATLDMILDNMTGDGTQRLEQSRKLVFRGTSGVWGVQARVRTATIVMAPSAKDKSKLDLTTVGGIVDFRRLRANVHWPLFFDLPNLYHDDGQPMAQFPQDEALDPAYAETTGPKLLSRFCSANMPAVNLKKRANLWVYELGDGPLGKTGAFSCFFGSTSRGEASRYASPEDKLAELFARITMPAEWLQFDVLVHRDLQFPGPPTVLVYDESLGGPAVGAADDDVPTIPVPERAVELSGSPPVISSGLVSEYEDILQYTLGRLGQVDRDFKAFRLTMKYPPMHTVVTMRFKLPEPESH